jgi:hypothetical protein
MGEEILMKAFKRFNPMHKLAWALFSASALLFITAIWTESSKIAGTGGVILAVTIVLAVAGDSRTWPDGDLL